MRCCNCDAGRAKPRELGSPEFSVMHPGKAPTPKRRGLLWVALDAVCHITRSYWRPGKRWRWMHVTPPRVPPRELFLVIQSPRCVCGPGHARAVDHHPVSQLIDVVSWHRLCTFSGQPGISTLLLPVGTGTLDTGDSHDDDSANDMLGRREPDTLAAMEGTANLVVSFLLRGDVRQRLGPLHR